MNQKNQEKNENKEEKKFPGLEQQFLNSEGGWTQLQMILVEGDWWEQKGKEKTTIILTHEAVQKIAKQAGFVCEDYTIKTQPDVYNNYQLTVQAVIKDKNGNLLEPQWGESNRNNLGSRGRSNPANMAQKRAYDRTVLKALGISGMLSEEELADNKEEDMENLTDDEKKVLAPILNKIILVKSKEQLSSVNTTIKQDLKKITLNEAQLTYLRKFFMKKSGELAKLKF